MDNKRQVKSSAVGSVLVKACLLFLVVFFTAFIIVFLIRSIIANDFSFRETLVVIGLAVLNVLLVRLFINMKAVTIYANGIRVYNNDIPNSRILKARLYFGLVYYVSVAYIDGGATKKLFAVLPLLMTGKKMECLKDWERNLRWKIGR